MEVIFEDKRLEDFISDKRKAGNRFKAYARDNKFYERLVNVINILMAVECTNDLVNFSMLHYEKLKHFDITTSSVRIMPKRKERLIFEEYENGIRIKILTLDENHYDNKK